MREFAIRQDETGPGLQEYETAVATVREALSVRLSALLLPVTHAYSKQ